MRGNKYILVITDHFTKWVEAYPITNQEAFTVGICLESFVNTFGYPDVMLTDQGRNFESGLIKEMCARLKIDKRTTSAYHPQCNGQTERFNRTMNSMLAQYVASNQSDWDQWLPSVLFAYRTAVHESTGFSPYKLLFGREPKQPIDFLVPVPNTSLSNDTPQAYFSALKLSMDSIQEQARSNLKHSQTSQKIYHDQSVTADKFAIGDLVLVYNPVLRGFPKFQKHWEGPYIVLSRMARGVTYLLRLADGSDKFLTVHRNRLKRCNSELVPEQRTYHVDPFPEPTPPAPQIPLVPAADLAPVQHQVVDQPIVNQLLVPPVEVNDAEARLQPAVMNAAANNEPHVNDQPQQLIAKPQAGVSTRPKREIRPPRRLVDEYATAFVGSRKEKKKK